MEPRRVRFGLDPVSEVRETRPVPRIPADPSDYSPNTERELGIEDNSDEEPIFVANERGRMVQTGEPLDGLTVNSDGTKYCAGGSRGVLKVFTLHDDNTLEQSVNFRRIKSKRLTLLYSPLDVCWNPNIENQIGSTSTNGGVVFWDVEQGRLDFHYKEHTRSATALKFHHLEPDIVISGSKDASVLMYDLRVKESIQKFASGSFDAVRDLQFCPHGGQGDIFAASDDSGTVRFWDRRRADKPYLDFHAHHGYVSSVQFSPKAKWLLATGGGRDKLIKIWDWSRPVGEGPVYSIETVAPVGKALWRPHGNGSTQLASCSVVNDIVVHFWDIRRPFLPYASFHDHKDSVIGLAFHPLDELRFVTAGKDGLVIVNDFRTHARYPINYANDVSIDTAPDGLMGVAVNSLALQKAPFVDKQAKDSIFSNPKPQKPFVLHSILSNPHQSSSPLSSSTSSGRGTASSSRTPSPIKGTIKPKRQVTVIDPKERAKGPVPTRPVVKGCISAAAALHAAAIAHNSTFDPFRGPTQSLIRCGQPDHASKHLTQRCFVEMALEYRMGGASPPQLAGFNSDVAERHGLHDVARSWRLVTGLVLHELRKVGYPPDWRTDEQERRKERKEQLALQMADEGEYLTRAVYVENGQAQQGVRLQVRPADLVADFALDSHEPGFRDDVLLRKKRRGRREVERNPDGTIKVHEASNEDDTSGEDDGEREEDGEKRTSRLARWHMRSRLRAKDKTNKERVRRTEAHSPVHDPMDDDARYGAFGEYHYGLQPTDVRRKTNEDLAWHGSARSAHTWRTLPDEAFGVQDMMGVRIEEEERRAGWRREAVRRMRRWGDSEEGELPTPPPDSYEDAETAASSVEQLLKRHADANDIQTCAVIAIVFGHLMVDLLGESLVFSWIAAYESMLDRLRLMTAVTEVRKYCDLPAIAGKSLAGTFLKLGCVTCRKLISGGKCEKCKRSVMATLCSVCHRTLSGLGWSCGGCGHAAHSKHARDWFERMAQCPVRGCDCECAYWAPPDETQPLLLRPRNLKTRPQRDPQRALTVETFLFCDQLAAANLQEEYYSRKMCRMRAHLDTPEHLQQQIIDRQKKLAQMRRHGVDMEEDDTDRWHELSSSSEEDIFLFRRGRRIRARRRKPGKRDKDGRLFMTTMPGFRGPLSRRLHCLEEAEEEEKEARKRRRKALAALGGVDSSEEEEEEEEEERWIVDDEGLGSDDDDYEQEKEEEESEPKEEEEVPWNCSCGSCPDCRLMRSWQRQVDAIEEFKGARRVTPGTGVRWRRTSRREAKAAAVRRRDAFATSLQRAMNREWGRRPRWRRNRARRYRPIVRERVPKCDSGGTKSSDDSAVTVIDRRRMPANTPAKFKRVRPGLGAGKEPRVPEEYRTNYATFTLGSLAGMLEWQAVDWQRKLGVRRLLPRAFYRHPLFAMNKKEMLEMPFARLKAHAADVGGVLQRLFGRLPRGVRLAHAQPIRPRGGGWRKRGRGLSGCGYSTKQWGRRKKRSKLSGRRGWRAAILAPRQPRLRFNPAAADYRRKLLEEEEEEGEGRHKCRKEKFISAYSRRIVGWSGMDMRRRMRVLAMRRYAEGVVRRNRESTRVRYEKWKRMEQSVWEPKIPRPPRRIFDPKVKEESERKRREREERDEELEKILNEKSLLDDLKALSAKNVARLPRVGEPKPACVKLDVEKEWAKRAGPRRFDLLDLYTDEENQRVAKYQIYVDEHARIARENKAVDEAKRRKKEKMDKDRGYLEQKREFWRRYHHQKKTGESIPPPPPVDPKDLMKEQRAVERREMNHAAKHWHMIHKKVLARSVDHLLDIQMIDTRKY